MFITWSFLTDCYSEQKLVPTEYEKVIVLYVFFVGRSVTFGAAIELALTSETSPGGMKLVMERVTGKRASIKNDVLPE